MNVSQRIEQRLVTFAQTLPGADQEKFVTDWASWYEAVERVGPVPEPNEGEGLMSWMRRTHTEKLAAMALNSERFKRGGAHMHFQPVTVMVKRPRVRWTHAAPTEDFGPVEHFSVDLAPDGKTLVDKYTRKRLPVDAEGYVWDAELARWRSRESMMADVRSGR